MQEADSTNNSELDETIVYEEYYSNSDSDATFVYEQSDDEAKEEQVK